MTPNMLDRPERDRRVSTWRDLTRRERAYACWLALRAGWNVDLERCTSYDTDCDRVLVEMVAGDPRSAATFGIVKWDCDETLRRIEERFGADARARAEETIGG